MESSDSFWTSFTGCKYSEVFSFQGPGCCGGVNAVECSTGRRIEVFLPDKLSCYTGYRVTLMEFRVLIVDDRARLVFEEGSEVFLHGPYNATDLLRVREFCSGMGALGLGAEQAGFQVVFQNDIQAATARVAGTISGLDVCQGDVASKDTIIQAWKSTPGIATTAAGFSCQPYSKLGDRRGGSDPRAATLPATLEAAWLLQSPLVVLECVAPAAEDVHVRQCLDSFISRTGYSLQEVVLELRDVWPACRKRWWSVLASKELGCIQVAGWKPHGAWRTIADVLESPNVSRSESLQLRLGMDEAQKLAAFKPLSSFVIQANAALPTALHSWGSLFRPCPCGCRAWPFAEERLRRDGVCAVILPDEGQADEAEVVPYRYPSASEVSLLCGLDPSLDCGPDARLALSLVGQLASPLQAGWVFAHIADHLRKGGLHFSGSTDATHVLHKQRLRLLKKAELVGLRPSHLFRMSAGPPDILFQTHAQILARYGTKARYAEVARQVQDFQTGIYGHPESLPPKEAGPTQQDSPERGSPIPVPSSQEELSVEGARAHCQGTAQLPPSSSGSALDLVPPCIGSLSSPLDGLVLARVDACGPVTAHMPETESLAPSPSGFGLDLTRLGSSPFPLGGLDLSPSALCGPMQRPALCSDSARASSTAQPPLVAEAVVSDQGAVAPHESSPGFDASLVHAQVEPFRGPPDTRVVYAGTQATPFSQHTSPRGSCGLVPPPHWVGQLHTAGDAAQPLSTLLLCSLQCLCTNA